MYIDQHFCGIGFYLAACDMIKEYYSELDRMQGIEVENMLREEMKEKGYNCIFVNAERHSALTVQIYSLFRFVLTVQK